MCTEDSSAISYYDHDTASTMAHEMGHNLGIEHDISDDEDDKRVCVCDDVDCIMTTGTKKWSNCSFADFAIFKREENVDCMLKTPRNVFVPSKCGNGVVDAGEECDCRTPAMCLESLCNQKTCKKRSDIVCRSGQCCTSQGQCFAEKRKYLFRHQKTKVI